MLVAAVIAAFIAQCGARNLMQVPTYVSTTNVLVPTYGTYVATGNFRTTPGYGYTAPPTYAPGPPGSTCSSTADCLAIPELGEFVYCNPAVGQCNACGEIGEMCCPFEDMTTGEMLADCRYGGFCIDGICEMIEQAGAPAPAPAQAETPSPGPTVLAPVYGAGFTGSYGYGDSR